jgi:hypothetical protein
MKRLTLPAIVFFGAAVLGISMTAAFNYLSHSTNPDVNTIFADLQFAGNGPFVARSVFPHAQEAKPLPKLFSAGQQYIFHRRDSVSHPDLFQLFQTRLRQQKVTVYSAVEIGDGYIGGIEFRIIFQFGLYTAAITNHWDGTKMDYILTILETKKFWETARNGLLA